MLFNVIRSGRVHIEGTFPGTDWDDDGNIIKIETPIDAEYEVSTIPGQTVLFKLDRTERGPAQIELWKPTTDPIDAINQIRDGKCNMIVEVS